MVKIAICDDNLYELQEISNKVKFYIEQQEFIDKPMLLSFSNGNNLIAEIESGRTAEIFILDIDMPECDGFQLTEAIRKYIPAPIIIFLTSYLEYGSQACKIHAFRYIHKLNMDKDIFEALDSALTELRKIKDHSIIVTHYNEFYRVPYTEIKCIQRSGRQLNILTCSSGTIYDSRGVKDFLLALNDRRFVLIDRGCIINIDFIKQIIGMEVILTTDERFSISRRMLKNLKLTLAREWNL